MPDFWGLNLQISPPRKTSGTDPTDRLLAHLYRMRWEFEKVFDEIKNRLNKKKAWATSANAKSMQGHFTALTHNLMLLLDEALKNEEQIEDEPELKRRKARRELECESERQRRFVDGLSLWLRRATQRGVKFIRWLRAQLRNPSSWSQACAALTTLYARL